jgi:hypothetical protein
VVVKEIEIDRSGHHPPWKTSNSVGNRDTLHVSVAIRLCILGEICVCSFYCVTNRSHHHPGNRSNRWHSIHVRYRCRSAMVEVLRFPLIRPHLMMVQLRRLCSYERTLLTFVYSFRARHSAVSDHTVKTWFGSCATAKF